MKQILILGTGHPKCKKLYEAALDVVKRLCIEAEVKKVEKINEIMNYGVIMTPALVVDGEVKSTGRIPKTEELKAMIGRA